MVDPSTLIPCRRNSFASESVSWPFSFAYPARGDSSPIHTHETPSSTSSFMLYLLMAFAEENTYSAQLLPFDFIRSSNSMARLRCSRKFSSIMKKDRTFISDSISHITRKSASPVSKKLRNFPFPPENANVVQKLHP